MRSKRSLTSAAAEFKIVKSTAHGIVKNEAKLQTFFAEIHDGDCIKKWQIVRRTDVEELIKQSTFGSFSSVARKPLSVGHY